MIGVLLATLVVLGCYMAARHLNPRTAEPRPGRAAHETREADRRPGLRLPCDPGRSQRHRCGRRRRDQWHPAAPVGPGSQTLLDIALITDVTRKIRYHEVGMALVVHYRVSPHAMPEEIVMPFESRQIRIYGRCFSARTRSGTR